MCIGLALLTLNARSIIAQQIGNAAGPALLKPHAAPGPGVLLT
jgi:hypothetical protein